MHVSSFHLTYATEYITKLASVLRSRESLQSMKSDPGGEGGTPIYGLYRYVPRIIVWFLRFSVPEQGIFFDPFVTVFLV